MSGKEGHDGGGSEFDKVAEAYWQATDPNSLSPREALEAAERTLKLYDERVAKLDLPRTGLNVLRSTIKTRLDENDQRPIGTESMMQPEEIELYKNILKRLQKAQKQNGGYNVPFSISGFETLKLRQLVSQKAHGTITDHKVAGEAREFLDTVSEAYLSAPEKYEPVKKMKGMRGIASSIRKRFEGRNIKH